MLPLLLSKPVVASTVLLDCDCMCIHADSARTTVTGISGASAVMKGIPEILNMGVRTMTCCWNLRFVEQASKVLIRVYAYWHAHA